ncbi:ABC transporter ATP-binding protein [Bacillus sp. 123MFChir2]|uniref:ABC transporter ATP-binding protein n=1 Tax=Bacillus sp. 123MFChir2 TaxID=1169144 RepID=UPI000372CF31|nr:ABC transporter ATP-binding protein [Bacillus sp. 123MFChir2]
MKNYIDKKTEFIFEVELKQQIILKASGIPLHYFELTSFYDHFKRINNNMGARFLLPFRNVMQIIQSILSMLSFLLLLFTIHWTLILVSILIAFPVFIVQSKFGVKRFFLFLYQTPVAREIAYIDFLLANREAAKEIKIFNLSNYLLRLWTHKFQINTKNSLELLKKEQHANVLLDVLTGGFYCLAAIIIIFLTKTTKIAVGEFIAVTQAIQGIQSSISRASEVLAKLKEDNLYIQDYFSFIESNNYSTDLVDGKPFPNSIEKGVFIKNLTFKYPSSEYYSLHNINLHIKPGEKIAIVGENGSGKTTLVKCLMGLYKPTEGNIYFDDLDIRDINPDSLRENLTAIFQDFIKYSFTVKENILFGDLKAREQKILDVAIQSGVDNFVKKFKNSYDTRLGKIFEEGEDLSGGQWQKIALARAMLKEKQFFVLDEPSSALDPFAEIELFQNLNEMVGTKTAIFISHRMFAAKYADKIIVMKKGRIIEQGSHDELINIDSEYARMYRLQAQLYNTEKLVSVVK